MNKEYRRTGLQSGRADLTNEDADAGIALNVEVGAGDFRGSRQTDEQRRAEGERWTAHLHYTNASAMVQLGFHLFILVLGGSMSSGMHYCASGSSRFSA
jgi:hypothetical protein